MGKFAPRCVDNLQTERALRFGLWLLFANKKGRKAVIRCGCKGEIVNGQTGSSSDITVHLVLIEKLSS